ncbi:MAG: hypothetical protein OXH57_04825, partial [Ekhidna sp.]|nr:hypothetical protein [Ekhidna sp.]
LWVADDGDDKVYAYTLATGAHNAAKDIDLDAANSSPFGFWSNGTTLWVSDYNDTRIFAYTLATGVRNAAKDITTRSVIRGIWSDGVTIWGSVLTFTKIVAYQLE